MKRLTAVVVVLIVLALGVGAIVFSANKSNDTGQPASNSTSQSNSSYGGTSAQPQQSSSPSSSAGQVKMTNMLFTPSQITVKKGESVTWTNDDNTAHTVIADKGNGPSSGMIQPGQTYSYTFNETGSFQYHCSLHSAMHGTIVVN